MGAPERRSEVKNSVGRIVLAGLTVIGQIIWLIVLAMRLNAYSTAISAFTTLLSIVIVLRIYASHRNTAMKMPWIMLILAFPLAGVCLYLMVGHLSLSRKMRKRFQKISADLHPYHEQDEQILEDMEKENPRIANQSRYISKFGNYPVCENTDVLFYDEAEKGFEAQLQEIRKAEKFIFMEYHAIEEAISFGRLREVLKERAANGVEVRIIYDDVGSIGFLDWDFIKRMEKDGIRCKVFNPVIPVLNLFMNNRDHRKITVIDGEVGFVGGYNLADEYFNITNPYGRWKDTGVRLQGDAVKNLTVTFLEMWNAIDKAENDYDRFFPEISYQAREKCFVQPYADSPLDQERVGESVYLNIIKNAKDYVYFTTPYLIITDEMNREFELAAKRGVDVRIITPGIPDKKIVFKLTRSYYAGLVSNGVRIFEYTPGFCHAKQCVSDGEVATVGTINLDYRSLYQHFENGVFFCGCDAVREVKLDFDRTFPLCEEVTEAYKTELSTALKISQCILRLFAPLL
ncbi:MAG: cardiolipin synthase [Lachnospiraceae bacterium]|nr:cardiolipin synthase [Lachnospiraceae bacterium]